MKKKGFRNILDKRAERRYLKNLVYSYLDHVAFRLLAENRGERERREEKKRTFGEKCQSPMS
jgi:hypothetical protein